jgi:putative transposase
MQPMLHNELAPHAFLAAAWRCKPAPGLMLHSDQGVQYTNSQWHRYCKSVAGYEV